MVKFLARMPLPLLLGLTALALIQLAVVVIFIIWPDQLYLTSMVAIFGTLLVMFGWVGVIVYEQVTGKRVGRYHPPSNERQ